MSSYSEQSGRRFRVESERASSHSSSLGSQEDEEAEAKVPNQAMGGTSTGSCIGSMGIKAGR
eukprot:9836189-Karenia_brevis.AAC.1